MAVRGIGGSRAYVITSRIDPQSTANYYAKLVSQQKYKLWEQAQQIALAEMKQAGATDEMLVKEFQNQREDLRREVADLRELDRKYQLQEVKSAQKIKENKAKFESGIGAGSKGGGGAAGRVVKRDTDDALVGELRRNAAREKTDAESSLQKSRNYRSDLLKEKKNLQSAAGTVLPANQPREAKINEELNSVNTLITAQEKSVKTASTNLKSYNTMTAKQKKAKAASVRPGYERIGYIAPEQGTTKEREYVEPQALSLADERAQIQSDIEARQAQISGLQAPQLSQFDLLGRTREIARDDFGQVPAQRSGRDFVRNFLRGGERQPGAVEAAIEEGGVDAVLPPSLRSTPTPQAIDPQRRAELEALGTDDAFLQTLGIESDPLPPEAIREPVVTGDVDLIRAEAKRRADAQFQESPATRLFSEAAGRPMGRKVQQELQAEDMTFDEMKAELEDERGISRYGTTEAQRDLYLEGRLEAEQNLGIGYETPPGEDEMQRFAAPFPDPFPVSEESRRTAITAPMVQGIPRNTFRDLEFEAMGIQELIEGPAEAVQVETTLTPDVKYRYDRITSSKAMLDNPYSWYSGTSKEDKPDWAVLVEKLYNPKKGKMEDLQNAWEQITISYSDNRAIMEKAHDYLLFIDRAEEASKKAQ